MLVTQVGEAFAFSAMPCYENQDMAMVDKMMSHSQDMPCSELSVDNLVELSSEDCCLKDCCCPMGLINLVFAVETIVEPTLGFKEIQVSLLDSSHNKIYLALPQRPPKISLSFAV
jgi:hypothetical protein